MEHNAQATSRFSMEDECPDAVRRRRRRRQEVAHWIHGLWTDGGSNDAGIVEPWLDGRLRLLGLFVTLREPDCNHAGMDYDVNDDDAWVPADASPPHRPFTIDRVHCNDLTYDEFLSGYMQPNLPVIINGLAENWRACREWTVAGESVDATLAGAKGQVLSPNVEYLGETFGEDVVKVAKQPFPGLGSVRPVQKEMTLAEFARYWKVHHSATPDDEDTSILYLKDYKFVAKHPDYHAYEWPHFFRDDWLNDAMGHAYKFVYLGPKGSSTVLHADVLRSYSWSTNVCGRKRWVLVPPAATPCLYDCFGQRLATHLRADVGELAHLFPGLHIARSMALEVIQEPGETIFIPSNVYHTVENLEATLSINHNWINCHNVHHCWRHVQSLFVASRDAHRGVGSGQGVASVQVMEDLMLLWRVVSHRAECVLTQVGATTDENLSRTEIEQDGRASLRVLSGIQEMLREEDYEEGGLERNRVATLSRQLQGVLSCRQHLIAPE